MLSDSTFATLTTIGARTGSYNQGWQRGVVDLQAFQGQRIKLRFLTDGDRDRNSIARIDNVSLNVEAPDWTPSDASVVGVISDTASLAGPYLQLSGYGQAATSSAFTVPADAQSVRFDYWTWTGRNHDESVNLYVQVLSDSTFATLTTIGARTGSYNQGWQQGVVDLQAFQGQRIKLRFLTDGDGGRNSIARIDNVYLLPATTTPYAIVNVPPIDYASTTTDTVSTQVYAGAMHRFDFGNVAAERYASTVSVAPGVLPADGVTTATITVTMRDDTGNPLPGRTVALQAPGTAVTVTQPLAPTDARGQTTGLLRATHAQSLLVTARTITDGVTLAQAVPVTFTAGLPIRTIPRSRQRPTRL